MMTGLDQSFDNNQSQNSDDNKLQRSFSEGMIKVKSKKQKSVFSNMLSEASPKMTLIESHNKLDQITE